MNMYVILSFLFLAQIYQTESSPLPKLLQTVTLEELVPLQPDFYPDRISVQWISDDEYLYRDPGYGIRKYNAGTDSFVTFLNEPDLYVLSNQSIASYSKDGRYLLLASNKKKVYRYSTLAEYSVYDVQTRNIEKLASGTLQVVLWGGKNDLAYVQHNNVYYVPDVTKPREVQTLTAKGSTGKVYFGVADWIYEEEVLNAAEALWFSPNSTHLAVASFNDTKVDSAVFPVYGNSADLNNQYPKMMQFKYPKAGRPNPVVGLRVFTLNESLREPWHILPPVHLIGTDYILGRVNWATDYNIVVLWLNRRQNRSILINCDLKNISCHILRDREEARGWIDIFDPFFDSTGTKMVEIQPLSHGGKRYLHAGRFDYTSLTIENLSPGNLTVTEISGWNLNTDTVYFIIASTVQPWLRQLWATSGGVVRCISCKESSCHSVNALFSKGAKFAILSCSASNVPHRTFLYNSNDDSVRLLKDSTRLIEKLSQYKQPMYLFNTINIGDDIKANVKLVLPSDMNVNEKYPMILRVYAGPGTTRVKDNFDLEYYNMYLSTNRSFIVASIDVRGSGVMGVEEMFAINRALGTVEVEDTLAAIRRLVELYPFIDPQRIGVFGWSYGGYVTTMMLIKDNQNTISCGAAVAPVTSWLYYDTIYTERYMDVPGANVMGYLNSDIIAKAEKLRGRRFLLVHGTGDDNVHFQHSMQLAKQLQHADIPFEQMTYVDESHSLLGVSRHFYHTLDRFWTKCFFSKPT